MRDKEQSFLDVGVKVGWHRALKEGLEYFNLMTAWERSPLPRMGEEEKEKIYKVISKASYI